MEASQNSRNPPSSPSKHDGLRSLGRLICCMILGLFCILSSLAAQTGHTEGEALPAQGVENERFFWVPQARLMRWVDGFWKTELKDVATVEECHAHLIVRRNVDRNLRSILIPIQGTDHHYVRDLICGDSILFAFEGAGYYVAVPAQPILHSISCLDRRFNDQQVQGQTAWSIPLPGAALDTSDTQCGELRNWGILNGQGKWLIRPVFDRPIHFQNGIAEVSYYGQRRKINERGEFVN